MRKMIKNIEAGAMPLVVILIIAVLVIAGIAFYVGSDGSSTSYWESKNEFGSWGQEIILGYIDGSTQSLKMLLDNPTLSVSVGGKQISYIRYTLSVTATGTGYSNIVVRQTSYSYSYILKQGSTTKSTYTVPTAIMSAIPDLTVAVDGIAHSLIGINTYTTVIAPSSLAAGTYTLYIQPSGTLSYNPDNEGWITASLPSAISFDIVITADKTLSISFSSGYSTS